MHLRTYFSQASLTHLLFTNSACAPVFRKARSRTTFLFQQSVERDNGRAERGSRTPCACGALDATPPFWVPRLAAPTRPPKPLGRTRYIILGGEGRAAALAPQSFRVGVRRPPRFCFREGKKNSLFHYTGVLDSSLLIPSIWRLQGAARPWVRARLLPPRISPRELCTSPPCFECVI